MPPSITALRNATATIDSIYTLISNESRKFMLERPEIAHLTEESAAAARAPPKLSYQDKLDMVYSLAQKPTQ